MAVDRHVERGDVAVADEGLGLPLHERVVEQREDPRRPVAAPHAPDRVDAIIGEHRVEIVGAGGIGARQIAIAGEEVRAGPHLEAERLQRLDGEADVLGVVRRRRGGDQARWSVRSEAARAKKRHAGILPRLDFVPAARLVSARHLHECDEAHRDSAGHILAFDGRGHRLLRDGVVVMEGDHILHVGPRFDGTVDETVSPDRIVTPGLISTHAHISGSPLDRSFIEDRGKPQFWYSGLFEMLPVRSEAQDEEGGRACVDFSMAELLRGGVTTVMEIGRLGEYVVERAPTTGCACTWARRSGRDAGSPGTASAWSGSGTRSRAGRGSSARSRSTSA